MNLMSAISARVADDAVNAELLAATGDGGTGEPRFEHGWPEFPIDMDRLPFVTFFLIPAAPDGAVHPFRVQFDIWAETALQAQAIDEALVGKKVDGVRVDGLLHLQTWNWSGWRIYGLASNAREYPAPQGEPQRRKRDFTFQAS